MRTTREKKLTMRTAINQAILAAGVLGFGLCAPMRPSIALADPPLFKLDTPKQLAKISVPHRPGAMAWSPDGAYLAAATLVVDVSRASVTTTLKVAAPINGVAFSADGKWLAVGSSPYTGNEPGELAIYDVPAFTRKFTAKPSEANLGFLDLAWSADGKTLCTIEGSDRFGVEEKRGVRRWTMPAFTEQPAIRTPQSEKYSVLAVSADGGTLAVAEYTGLLRLFDLSNGAERTSFAIGSVAYAWRLGFSSDGKAVVLFNQGRPSWFDTATGKPAKPKPARAAIQPAALSDQWNSRYAFLPDCSKQVWGGERHPTFVFQKESKTEHGAFIDIMDNVTGKTWKWRVGETNGTQDTPVVAISADGTKLAGAARQAGGEAIMIWTMPR